LPSIIIGTSAVNLDEPCLGLYELDYQSPGNKGFHRYQIILVMRDDKPAEFRKDLGRSKKFKGIDQFRIPGGAMDETTQKWHIEHTVGELINIANTIRGKPSFDKRELIGVEKIKES